MKKIRLVMLVFILVLSVAGCETIKGIGRDIQNTGDNLQDLVNGTPDTL